MKIRAIIISLLLFSCTALSGAPIVLDSVKFRGDVRKYYIGIPDNPAPGRPLVICLHGYGGSAEKYLDQKITPACLGSGFAICIPQGLKDPKGKNSWNVGYNPKQTGWKVDDVAFVAYLGRAVAKKYGLDASNVFLTGMSNGGEMCYLTAYRRPEAFAAIASVSGLQMDWMVRKYKPKGTVPFAELHGTADKTSLWEGDPENKYGWGKYLAVPAAVCNIVAMNGCVVYSKSSVPVRAEGNEVILHRYSGGNNGSEVLFYEVVGGTHSWCTDIYDSCGEILKFFTSHIRLH